MTMANMSHVPCPCIHLCGRKPLGMIHVTSTYTGETIPAREKRFKKFFPEWELTEPAFYMVARSVALPSFLVQAGWHSSEKLLDVLCYSVQCPKQKTNVELKGRWIGYVSE